MKSTERKLRGCKMPELSIYMPVYNAGKFLEQAIESVLNQEFRDFEFYIHDDGSTDGSYDVCRRFAEQDRRIVLERGANGTSVVAMNRFVKEANGVYIGFIDHDDYLDKSYFSDMMRKLHETGADVAISSYTLVDSENAPVDWYTPTLKDGEILGRNQVLAKFLTSLDVEGFRWNKIYKKTIFTDNDVPLKYKFPGDIPWEFDLLSCVGSAVMVDSKGYYYRQSAGSEVATVTADKSRGFLSTFRMVGSKAENAGLVREGRFYATWRSVNSLFNCCKNRKRYSKQDWHQMKKEYNLKRWLGMNFFQVVRTVMEHGSKRDSRLKFLIKTVIVWSVYR
jgi:glycosyltransferase involved in cell wall biosynthesis